MRLVGAVGESRRLARDPLLADAAVEALRPVQERYLHWRQQPGAVETVLRDGQARATAVAEATLERVRRALGFLPPS